MITAVVLELKNSGRDWLAGDWSEEAGLTESDTRAEGDRFGSA